MSDTEKQPDGEDRSADSEWFRARLRVARDGTLRARTALATLGVEHERDRARLLTLSAEVEAGRERVAELERQVSESREELAEKDRAHIEKATELARLEVRGAQLERRLGIAGSRLRSAEARVLALEADLAGSRAEISRSSSRLEEAERESERIKARADSALGGAQLREERLRKQLAEIETRVTELRERLKTEAAELGTARSEQDELRAGHTAAIARFENSLEELGKRHSAELAAAAAERDEIQAKFRREGQRSRENLEHADAARVERDAARHELEELGASNRRELEEVRANLELAEDQRREQAALKHGLESEVTAATQAVGRAEADLAASRERIEALEADARRVREAEDHARQMAAQLARTRELAISRGDKLRFVTGTRSYRFGQESWRLRAAVRAQRGIIGAIGAIGVGLGVAAILLGLWWLAPVLLIGVPAVALLAFALRRRRGEPTVPGPVGDSTETPEPRVAERPAETVAAGRIAPQPTTRAAPAVAATPSYVSPSELVAEPAIEILGPAWDDSLLAARDLSELTVAAILDEMSLSCFAAECEILAVSRRDWQNELESSSPDLLLVESAWSGNGGGWQYGVASYEAPQYAGLPDLRALITWCRAHDIPTVFWNKEDPVHFERFKEAAALFDHVLTTDEGAIGRYEALGSESIRSVGAMPFAVQQRIFHPLGAKPVREESPVFAGTYYRDRHPERRRALEMLLDAARPHGLVIYDRTAGQKSESYGFPARFEPHVKGRLPYEALPEVFRSHKIGLNANSVIDSPTMFSRRVFEIVACGAAVVSTPSAGVESFFGSSVPQVEGSTEAAAALDSLISDEATRSGLVRRARRLVLANHTYRDRLATIAGVAGVAWSDAKESTSALVPIGPETPEDAARSVLEALSAQQTPPQEIVVGLAGDIDDREELLEPVRGERVRVIRREDAGDPSVLAAYASSARVTVCSPGAVYGPEHLTALRVASRTTESDLAGGLAAHAGTTEERFSLGVPVHPDAAVARRELVVARGWPRDRDSASREFSAWARDSVRVYLDEPGDAAPADGSRAGRA